jgi:S-adenosyl-L-methionine hydrolase (adenosine-forming)
MPTRTVGPIVTLTTDFGTSDYYAGAMKGVILTLCPAANIVDISHEVQAFSVRQGAYLLHQASLCFPPKTIHVAVIDPGVGTARRPVLVEACGQYFIGPDNGVFASITALDPKAKGRELTNAKLFRQPVSKTFHGRDIFASVAGHLATGVLPSRAGKRIEDLARVDFAKPLRYAKRVWTGTVIHIDRFGNLITNFHIDDFPQLPRAEFDLAVGLEKTSLLVGTFGEASPGELVSYIGSSGNLEVAVNQGSAAARLRVGVGAPVEITFY